MFPSTLPNKSSTLNENINSLSNLKFKPVKKNLANIVEYCIKSIGEKNYQINLLSTIVDDKSKQIIELNNKNTQLVHNLDTLMSNNMDILNNYNNLLEKMSHNIAHTEKKIVCKSMKNDGKPCHYKPVINGYCRLHSKKCANHI